VWGNPDSDRAGPVTYGVAVLLLVAATDRELCGHDGLVCGVGPVEAAAATARTLALHRFDAVLHVGLAGGRDVAIGSVVVGTEAVYRDLSAEWPVVDRVTPDAGLVERIRAALPDAAAAPIHTSAAVGGSSGTVSPGPLIEAMEGFGVLRAAQRAGVPGVEVRVVSNEIGEEDRSRWQLGAALDALEDALPRIVRALVDADAR
jgi:futalosine hydrolase